MAVNASDSGFFSTNGTIKTDAFKPTSSTNSQTEANSTEVAEQAAATTTASISEAVVVKISSQLNVGDTGYDSGAKATLDKALAANAENTAKSSNAASEEAQNSYKALGGSYQNKIIDSTKPNSQE